MWPEQPAELRDVYTAYYQAMERLATAIMRAFALALDLRERFFADKIDRHISGIRVINYPDQPVAPPAGQLRAGAHSDYGALTILKSENVPGGLQVLNRAGDWVEVEPPQGAFVVNIGDLMMHWTNDRWTSTLHRVVNPPRDAALGSRRQSIVFFFQPNYDALIECLPSCTGPDHPPRYEPVTSGEHRLRKFLRRSRPRPSPPPHRRTSRRRQGLRERTGLRRAKPNEQWVESAAGSERAGSPAEHAESRSAPGPPGRDERWGFGGHFEAPM